MLYKNNGSVKVSKPNNIKTGIYSVKNNTYIHKTQPNPIKNIGKAINKFDIKVKPHQLKYKVIVKKYLKYHKVIVKYQQYTKQSKTHSYNSFEGRANTYHRTKSKSSF